jgi:hypothetical protein
MNEPPIRERVAAEVVNFIELLTDVQKMIRSDPIIIAALPELEPTRIQPVALFVPALTRPTINREQVVNTAREAMITCQLTSVFYRVLGVALRILPCLIEPDFDRRVQKIKYVLTPLQLIDQCRDHLADRIARITGPPTV